MHSTKHHPIPIRFNNRPSQIFTAHVTFSDPGGQPLFFPSLSRPWQGRRPKRPLLSIRCAMFPWLLYSLLTGLVPDLMTRFVPDYYATRWLLWSWFISAWLLISLTVQFCWLVSLAKLDSSLSLSVVLTDDPHLLRLDRVSLTRDPCCI